MKNLHAITFNQESNIQFLYNEVAQVGPDSVKETKKEVKNTPSSESIPLSRDMKEFINQIPVEEFDPTKEAHKNIIQNFRFVKGAQFDQVEPYFEKVLDTEDYNEEILSDILWSLKNVGANFDQAKPYFDAAIKSKDENLVSDVIHELVTIGATFDEMEDYLDEAKKWNKSEKVNEAILYALLEVDATEEQTERYID